MRDMEKSLRQKVQDLEKTRAQLQNELGNRERTIQLLKTVSRMLSVFSAPFQSIIIHDIAVCMYTLTIVSPLSCLSPHASRSRQQALNQMKPSSCTRKPAKVHHVFRHFRVDFILVL